MGYFPNGTSGMIYEEEVCAKCVHRKGPDGESGCSIMFAHMLHNYAECNKEDSILHILIPRDKDTGFNKKCTLFHEDASVPDPNQLDMFGVEHNGRPQP